MKDVKNLALIIVAITLYGSTPSICQRDTIYLDNKFMPTEKGKHAYYRLLDKMPAGNYKIRDYYRSGAIQMAGYADQPDAKHLTGTVVRYDSDGTISSVCEHKSYTDGWITFYDDNFIKTSSLWCVQGLKNGVAYFYDEQGKELAKGWYKNDRPFKGKMPDIPALRMRSKYSFLTYSKGKRIALSKYYAFGQKAMIGLIDSTEYGLLSAKYYNQNGRLIGKCLYSGTKPANGTHVEYYDKIFWSQHPASIKYIETYVDLMLTERKSYSPHGDYLGTCTFQYGEPLDGKWLQESTLKTYRDGQLEGEVVEWSSDFKQKSHSYTMHNSMKHGPTSYFHPLTDSVFVGHYVNDYPDTGYIYHRSELCYYIGAKKNGLCRSLDAKGNISSHTYYTDNEKEGESVSYEYPELGQIRGWYISGEPFNGDFVSSSGRTLSVTHYENGTKINIKKYNRESFVLVSLEDILSQTTTCFDTNGVVLFTGLKKNDQPYEGTFIEDREVSTYQHGRLNGEKRYFDFANELVKSETYVNDTLHGPYVLYKDKSPTLRGVYQNGRPYSGTFLNKDKKNGVLTYERGMIQGTMSEKNGSFNCQYNYTDGVITGDALCWRLRYKTGSDSMVFKHLMPALIDTLFLHGTYADGKPLHGTFLESNTISQYVNGKKHGYSFIYSTFTHTKFLGMEVYQNGLLDGEALYDIDGRPFHSVFHDGQIVSGIKPVEKHFSLKSKNEFAIFENGVPTGDSLICIKDIQWIYKKGGVIFEGFKRREPDYTLVDEYQQGKLVKTSFTHFNKDTVWTVMYHGDSSVTYDKAKNIIATTTYTNAYSDGLAQLYKDGKLSNTIRFKDGYIDAGCMEYVVSAGTPMSEDIKYMRICKDSTAVTMFLTPDKKLISREVILPTESKVAWPYTLSYSSFYELINGAFRTDKYYNKETGRLMATYISSPQGNSGTAIRQNGNRFSVDHTEKDETSSYDLSYDELLEKLKGWEK